MRPKILKCLMLLAAIVMAPLCHAWGAEGHRIVGMVADKNLTPKTRIALRNLMGTDSVADYATWMDEVRGTPVGRTMTKWHYINIGVCKQAKPACPNGECAPNQIQRAMNVLAQNRQGDDAVMAVRILAHLVGDIHQPLHAADNHDGGGNGVHIMNRRCGSGACSLHSYWDSSLVKAAVRGHSEKHYAQSLPLNLENNDSIDPMAWATESESLAKSVAYAYEGFACGGSSEMQASQEYDRAGVSVVNMQLSKAGLRLARILNTAFDR